MLEIPRVIHKQESTLPFQNRAIERNQLLFLPGHLRLRLKRAKHAGHRLACCERLFALTPQIQIDLRIGKQLPNLVGQLERERRLPHSDLTGT